MAGTALANMPADASAVKRCRHRHTRSDFHRVARRVLAGWGLTRPRQRRLLNHVIRCQRRAVSRPILRKHRRRYRQGRNARRARVLHVRRDWCSPDPHPDGAGCWEIPAWCVSNESGADWTAHNPRSPARGAYQLLGHGEPWPVDSWQDAMAHHRIAEGLYAARGLQPWVAC